MKTVVIANPMARAGKVGRQWPQLEQGIQRALGSFEARFTTGPGQATVVARRALDEGAERIAVVGGDGTINEVLNGFVDPTSGNVRDQAALVVIPVGTGGDFSRSVGLAGVDFVHALAAASERRIDVGRAEMTSAAGRPLVRHFLNISSFGASGLIDNMVNSTTKVLGAKASFMLGTLKGLVTYKNQRVRLRIDDTFDEEVLINVVAVANGRYFGGSMRIAPYAVLDDGLFEVVVVGDYSLVDFVRRSSRIYAGTHMDLPDIRRFSGKRVEAAPVHGNRVLIDLDGEQPGILPVRYDIVPAAVRLLAPWQSAEGVQAPAARAS
jgi:YegS/Rv2252/BmrU family lipid kinase